MNPKNREPIFRALVDSQNNIGWQHLLRVRFSSQWWTQIQGRHILDEPEIGPEKQSSKRWLKLILHHIWTNMWHLWLARNEDLHGPKRKMNQNANSTRKAPSTYHRLVFQSGSPTSLRQANLGTTDPRTDETKQ